MMTMAMRKKIDHSGVNRMIVALLLFALFGHVVPDSDVYEPLNTQNLEAKLIEEIEEAISGGDYFYIGAAGARGTPIQTLCSHQGDRTTKPDASKCNRYTRHPADRRAAKVFRVKLDTVFYANRFDSKAVVCGIQKRLIAKYRPNKLCLNNKPGQNNCIRANEGIVYLRKYD